MASFLGRDEKWGARQQAGLKQIAVPAILSMAGSQGHAVLTGIDAASPQLASNKKDSTLGSNGV